MVTLEQMAEWARLAEASASDARANSVFTAAAFAAPRQEVLAGIAEYVADWRRLAREAVPALLAEVERLRGVGAFARAAAVARAVTEVGGHRVYDVTVDANRASVAAAWAEVARLRNELACEQNSHVVDVQNSSRAYGELASEVERLREAIRHAVPVLRDMIESEWGDGGTGTGPGEDEAELDILSELVDPTPPEPKP